MKEYLYQPATEAQLEARWDINIAQNPGDDRWAAWRLSIIEDNKRGLLKTFVVLHEGLPVGEGTLVFSPQCIDLKGWDGLADGTSTVNVSALRMDKPHEGRGYMSKLVKVMEQYAREAGYQVITIGVEAKETRNLGIYLHWGYNNFISHAIEDGELVLCYSKQL